MIENERWLSEKICFINFVIFSILYKLHLVTVLKIVKKPTIFNSLNNLVKVRTNKIT